MFSLGYGGGHRGGGGGGYYNYNYNQGPPRGGGGGYGSEYKWSFWTKLNNNYRGTEFNTKDIGAKLLNSQNKMLSFSKVLTIAIKLMQRIFTMN